MLILEPDPKLRTVDDYDIQFVNGGFLPVSIDKEAGDTISIESPIISVHYAKKLSPVDHITPIPPEDLLIYTTHVLTILHRTREVPDLTTTQRVEWTKTLQEMNGTIQ